MIEIDRYIERHRETERDGEHSIWFYKERREVLAAKLLSTSES